MGYREECLRAEEHADHLREVIPAISDFVNARAFEEMTLSLVKERGHCGEISESGFVCLKKTGHKKPLHKAKRVTPAEDGLSFDVVFHNWV